MMRFSLIIIALVVGAVAVSSSDEAASSLYEALCSGVPMGVPINGQNICGRYTCLYGGKMTMIGCPSIFMADGSPPPCDPNAKNSYPSCCDKCPDDTVIYSSN